MYNEEENVRKTLQTVAAVLKNYYEKYEILVVNDGSQDNTSHIVKEYASANPQIILLEHPINMGMGRALITGFEYSTGDVVITLDADLSYDPLYIPKLIETLDSAAVDIVIGSQYMAGGKTESIPFHRLFISKMANKIVGYALTGDISTVTGILRAYRREVLDSIELESPGTEINPEILSKANAVGYKIKEIPVVLKGREYGESKVKIKSTTISHLLFTFYEKPMMLFGIVGLSLCVIGIVSAIYLFYLYLIGSLDPTRPLMLFMVVTILSGIQILIFGFVATQISLLKREIYLVQKENKLLRKKLK
ncbi:family 2 glycosyl transferase [Methanobacterium formicicum DSM 3637]|uniref:Family 2 glycosyl transferase n=2 Tax=Methanobacterium formicicum TaxID=2162 RepID=K2QDB9_METFP|nr:family 2 glycosyl transferase [Methanobacterium formicicum DSM 3637]